jgi:hypothetical protein
MKSEKARQYLLKVVTPIAMMYPDCPGECDIKLIEAKRAIELAEQEAEERMRRKAKEAFISCCDCEEFQYDGKKCENCDTYKSFIQKLNGE